MAEFLEVEDYVFETNSNGCVGSAKKLFKDFINIKPEQIESFIVNDNSGFANFAFTEVYDSGTLSIIKGSEFLQEYNKVRLTFNAEKMVFTKYSDKTKSINLNLTINGFVEENILHHYKPGQQMAQHQINLKLNKDFLSVHVFF